MPHCAGSHASVARLALVSAVLVGALMAAGCNRKPAPPPAAAPEVSVITVAPQRVVLATELPGRVSAFRTADVRPQVSGVLKQRLFSEGAAVRAGQVLYQIEPAPYRAALDNARATLARVESQLPALRLRAERVRSLLPGKAVSEQDVDDTAAALKQAEAEVRSCQAAIAAAEINLGYCRIVAPISGRIGRSSVTEGALVTAHQPLTLATIQEMDSVYVDMPQSTSEVLQLRRRLDAGLVSREESGRNTVSLLLEDATPYAHKGSFKFRDITTDPTTGSVILRAVFHNPEAFLLPGMFVRASVEEGTNANAILIPQQGVTRTPKGEPIALVVGEGSTVEQRPLTLDRAVGNHWLVATGLQVGDQVIVEGSLRVRPGMAVMAVPFDDGQAQDSRQDQASPR